MTLPIITVFFPITRAHYVGHVLSDLASTDLEPSRTNLVFLIDCESPNSYARIMQEMNRVQYRKFIIIRNYEHTVNEANIPLRRQRIAEIHNQSKEAIRALDGEYVLGLEDDTVFTNLSVEGLYWPFIRKEKRVGLVSAYQAGRWYNKIVGIWQFDDATDPGECWTALPGEGYEDIDAAGFYCYLTPTELYLAHHYSTHISDPWGPDVGYGLALSSQDYTNYVDWQQPVGHRDQDKIILPESQLYQESFVKTDLGWERRKQPLTG
jgi:hypothetical protein